MAVRPVFSFSLIYEEYKWCCYEGICNKIKILLWIMFTNLIGLDTFVSLRIRIPKAFQKLISDLITALIYISGFFNITFIHMSLTFLPVHRNRARFFP